MDIPAFRALRFELVAAREGASYWWIFASRSSPAPAPVGASVLRKGRGPSSHRQVVRAAREALEALQQVEREATDLRRQADQAEGDRLLEHERDRRRDAPDGEEG